MTVFLDYASTTPCDPRVVEAMKPYFSEHFGNPASLHCLGVRADEAVSQARRRVSSLVKAPTRSLYFTSGATESNNVVLRSLVCKNASQSNFKPTVVITNSEHSSIRETSTELFMSDLMNVRYLNIDTDGRISLDELKCILKSDKSVALVSVIFANNEIGTIHPIKQIGEICKQYGVLFHTDATQAYGKVDIDVDGMCIDALSISAHKIYGPKGIGGLYLREPSRFNCLITGGAQETITSGTTNVPGVVGFGRAAELMEEEQLEQDRIAGLRDAFYLGLTDAVYGGIYINGGSESRLYNNLNIGIKGVPAEALIGGLDDICISTGSACASGSPQPSYVIRALGNVKPEESVRITFGRWNTDDDVRYAVGKMAKIINTIRGK